jgi:hypothetical protein
MDLNSSIRGLEMLAMVICQNSIHAAFQLNFQLNAAMEDYQPELANGKHNNGCNPFYFTRCARLVQAVERAVIYGSRQSNHNFDSNSLDGQIKHNDMKLNMIKRTLGRDRSIYYDGTHNGQLFYKRVERKSAFHTKPWKLRYFVVDQRVLLCYREPHAVNPKRTISLQNCRVIFNDTTSDKYGDTLFEIVNDSNNARFLLRAQNAASRENWVKFLEE